MELLCPACQRKLTIPDQFAGQMAKCPQCGHTFTAPELPALPPTGFVPPPALPPPPPAAPTPVVTAPPVDGQGIISPGAIPAPAPQVTAAPSVPPSSPAAPAPAVSPTPGEYKHHWSFHLRPHVLHGVAIIAVLVVFVLSFVPWIGQYPGGVPVVTQSAWQAAFGAESVDEPGKKVLAEMGRPLAAEAPGANGLLIVYVLLLLLTLLLTLAAVVVGLAPFPLPPALQALRPWRWGLVGLVALLALVFLVLQEVSGFSLEKRLTAEVDQSLEREQKQASASGATLAEIRRAALLRGLKLGDLHRSAAVAWATALHLLAVICALLAFRLERRSPRPLPRVELQW